MRVLLLFLLVCLTVRGIRLFIKTGVSHAILVNVYRNMLLCEMINIIVTTTEQLFRSKHLF